MKKIYKYPTGAEIPEGAIYLETIIQREIEIAPRNGACPPLWEDCWLVWHYFLVEV